jgi:hypothetical protein
VCAHLCCTAGQAGGLGVELLQGGRRLLGGRQRLGLSCAAARQRSLQGSRPAPVNARSRCCSRRPPQHRKLQQQHPTSSCSEQQPSSPAAAAVARTCASGMAAAQRSAAPSAASRLSYTDAQAPSARRGPTMAPTSAATSSACWPRTSSSLQGEVAAGPRSRGTVHKLQPRRRAAQHGTCTAARPALPAPSLSLSLGLSSGT